MKIWCLFSIDNEYDQPDNNLCAFWSHKPTFHDVKKYFEPLPPPSHYMSMDQYYGMLSRGLEVRIGNDTTNYRIEEIEEGIKL